MPIEGQLGGGDLNRPTDQLSNSITASAGTFTSAFEKEIDEIRKGISADHDHLQTARERLNAVLAAASSFSGHLKTFQSGSVKHRTVNRPVNDGDGCLVLDRRTYPDFGPDSEVGAGSILIVDDVANHVRQVLAEKGELSVEYVEIIKRAIVFHFVDDGSGANPSVDLVVGLTRKDAEGLWIPNRDTDSWDPSHPEKHNDLLTAEPEDLRRHRARAIRLAKEIVKTNKPQVLSSFNIEALALELVTAVEPLGESLKQLFEEMASQIAKKLTPDPADVSPDIKLPDGISQEYASERLAHYASRLAEAQLNDDDESRVKEVLAEIFPAYYEANGTEAKSPSKSPVAKALATGNLASPAFRSAFGIKETPKNPRSFGR